MSTNHLLPLIRLLARPTHHILHRASNASLGRELLSNHALLVQGPAHLLSCSAESSLGCQFVSILPPSMALINGLVRLTSKLLSHGTLLVEQAGLVVSEVSVCWCLGGRGLAAC